jgi:Lon protease-like protein
MSTLLPMFPLGTVLVPHALLPLQIFEPRYQVLMFDITHTATTGAGPEFGVLLIERGSEVGGGDSRFSVGTVARVVQAGELPDGRWLLHTMGTRRFRVEAWAPDDPYPRAEVVDLPESPWDECDRPALEEAEASVRAALRLGAQLGGEAAGFARADVELALDPVIASWQLTALSPIGAMDRQRLLETDDRGDRLRQLAAASSEAARALAYHLEGGQS